MKTSKTELLNSSILGNKFKTDVNGSVSKVDKINKEIEKHEKELERLFILAQNVSGGTVDVCPQCKTKNYHWSINNKWCCAFC